MKEFLHSHTSVVWQPDFAEMNPYALGFNLFMDIKRICEHPTEEDKKWFKDIAVSPWLSTLKFAAESFKEESAILQFLSPKLIRDFKFFSLLDDDHKTKLEVTAIHNDDGYRHVRKILSEQHDIHIHTPHIEVCSVDRDDRKLTLRHQVINRRPLHADDAKKVLVYLEKLWEFPVEIAIESEGKTKTTWRVSKGELVNG